MKKCEFASLISANITLFCFSFIPPSPKNYIFSLAEAECLVRTSETEASASVNLRVRIWLL